MDRAQPGAIDSIVRNDELAQALGQFSDGWIVPGDDPTPAAQRREDVDDEALDGFDLSHSPTSLEVTVEPGEAFVDGWLLRDEPTEILLDADSTTDIVVGWNPDAIFNDEVDANRDEADETIVTTADAVDELHPTSVIWTVETDGDGVVAASDERDIGPALRDDITAEPIRQLRSSTLFLAKRLNDARLDIGLERLDFDDGQIVSYFDESQVTTVDNATINPGGPPTESGSAFLEQFIDIDQLFENGEQLEYEIADSEDVEDGTLELTGHDSTSDEERNWSALEDGDSIQFDVGGSTHVDVDVGFSGGGSQSEQQWIYSEPLDTIEAVGVDSSTNTVFSADRNHELHAIDADAKASGASDSDARKWTYDQHTGQVKGVTVDESDGNVYTVTNDGEVHAIDATDGSQLWVYTDHSDNGLEDVAVDESTSTVYSVGLDDEFNGEIHAIDADAKDNGESDSDARIWSYDGHSDRIRAVEVDEEDNVVYTGGSDDQLHAINADDGTTKWTYDSVSTIYGLGVDSSTNTVIVTIPGEVQAVDADAKSAGETDSDALLWSYTEQSGTIWDATVNPSSGTVFTAEENVHAIDIDDGSQESIYDDGVENTLIGIAFSESEVEIYVGGNDEEVHAVDVMGSAEDPSLTIDDKTVSYSGSLESDEEHTETLQDVSTDSYDEIVSLTDGGLDVTLNWTETTETVDPSVTINSDAGEQTITHTGTIPDGTAEDLSDEIDESVKEILSEPGTISVSVSENVDGPVGKVGVELSAGPATGTVEHVSVDPGFVTEEIVLNDEVEGSADAITYQVADSADNEITIERDDIDTILDVSEFEQSELTITAVLSEIGPELVEWGAYFSGGS